MKRSLIASSNFQIHYLIESIEEKTMPVPRAYKCLLTGKIMMDPVILSGDNYTYERTAITEYLKTHATSPTTGLPLIHTDLIENLNTRQAVDEYLQEHPELFDEQLNESIAEENETVKDEVFFQAEAMLSAIENHEIEKVLAFYQRDKRFFTKALDSDGFTAFHYVCQTGSLLMLKKLLAELSEPQFKQLYASNYTPPLNWQPDFLNELLLEASKEGKDNTVTQCLALGADVNATSESEHDDTPLHLAVKYGHTNTVALLLGNQPDLEAKAIDGSTPLNFAAFYGHAAAAQLLLDAGANLNNTDNAGNTPFHDAMARKYQQVATLLLQAGADRHSQNKMGKTPFDVGDKTMQTWFTQARKNLKAAKENELQVLLKNQSQQLELLSTRLGSLLNTTAQQTVQINGLVETRQAQQEQARVLQQQLTEVLAQKAEQDKRLEELQQSLQLQKLASEPSTEPAESNELAHSATHSPRCSQ